MKCEFCGGNIVEDQWNPFGGEKCMMCGRKPKTEETMSNRLNPEKEEMVKALLKDHSIRDIIKETGVAKNTIIRIRNENFTEEEKAKLKKWANVKGRNKRELEREDLEATEQRRETKVNEDQKTKICSKCKEPMLLTEELFSHNHSTSDGWERFCKACASKMRKDRKEKTAGKNSGNRKHGNNGGRARKRTPIKEMQLVRGSGPIMNSEQLFRTFRYTLAYEICDEVVGHINQLKEKLASELHLSKA